MLAPTAAPMTVEEFMQLPETMRSEQLIDGVLYTMTPPTTEHQDAAGNLFVWLKIRLREIGGRAFIVPIGVRLSDHNMLEPDVCWIAPDGRAVVELRLIRGVPDFVAEVLSPSTAKFDRSAKFRLYERHGVRELWLVDPAARLVEVWVLREGKFAYIDAYTVGETFTSPLFSTVEVGALFPDAA